MEASYKERQCRDMLERGFSYAQIKEKLHMSDKTIAKIARGGSYERAGRPKKLGKEQVDFIEMNSEANACLSDQQVADLVAERFGIQVSDTTILRVRNELGFHYRPPKVKQLLTPAQKELRVAFCKYVLENKDSLPPIVFSDESRFSKGPDNRWRRIRRGQVSESCFVQMEKFTKSVMVWGGISMSYRTPLVLCSNGVNAAEYQSILLRSGFIEDMNGHYGIGKWVFQQDGAAPHTCESTERMLFENKVCLLPGWPPNSPDLNPIEMIWAIMKRRANWEDKQPDQMFAYIESIWRELAWETIDQLVTSFVNRCELVLKLGGESVTPILRGHHSIHGPLPNMVSQWSDEEDRCIMQLVDQHGPAWTKIAAHLQKDAHQIKYRFRQLRTLNRNACVQQYQPLPPIQDLLAGAGATLHNREVF